MDKTTRVSPILPQISIGSVTSITTKPDNVTSSSGDKIKKIIIGKKSYPLKKLRSRIDELSKLTVGALISREILTLMQKPSPFLQSSDSSVDFNDLLFSKLLNNSSPFISSADFIIAAYELASNNQEKFGKDFVSSITDKLPKLAQTVSVTIGSDAFSSAVLALCSLIKKEL